MIFLISRSFLKRSCSSPRFVGSSLLVLGALQIVALLVAFERPARAYVDPGSGFVFLQVAASMGAGAIYYLRHRLKRILHSLRHQHGFFARGGTNRGYREPAMSQGTSQEMATFRDPAGSLRIQGEQVLRTVSPRYAAEALRFLESDLARRWTEQATWWPAIYCPRKRTSLYCSNILGYFFLLSLGMDARAVGRGWGTDARTMRPVAPGRLDSDATPLNILFDGARPVF